MTFKRNIRLAFKKPKPIQYAAVNNMTFQVSPITKNQL